MTHIDANIEKVIEATHHGPTEIPKPITFVEIGSDLEMWNNEKLVGKLVEAVLKGIERMEETDCQNTTLIYGGPHYSKLASTVAQSDCISHIISKHYISELSSNIIIQSIERNITRPRTAVLDSIPRSKRETLTSILSSNNISIELR